MFYKWKEKKVGKPIPDKERRKETCQTEDFFAYGKKDPHLPHMAESCVHASVKTLGVLIPTENQTPDDRILGEVHHNFSLCLHYGFLPDAEQGFGGPGNWVSDADSRCSFHHQLHHVSDTLAPDPCSEGLWCQGEPEMI